MADTDPGASRAQRTGALTVQHRFPDLARKEVWREKIEAIPRADVYLRNADGSFEQVAFGESDGYSVVSAVDVEQPVGGDATAKEEPLPWFVHVGLKQIAVNPAGTSSKQVVKIVSPIGLTHPVFSLPVVIDQDGVIDTALLFTRAGGGTRQRRGCFVEVIGSGQLKNCLVIIEGVTTKLPPFVCIVQTADVVAALALTIVHTP